MKIRKTVYITKRVNAMLKILADLANTNESEYVEKLIEEKFEEKLASMDPAESKTIGEYLNVLEKSMGDGK